MAKKSKKKLTIEEVRELSAKKEAKIPENESLPDLTGIEYYEDTYNDEDPDYIRNNEDGL